MKLRKPVSTITIYAFAIVFIAL